MTYGNSDSKVQQKGARHNSEGQLLLNIIISYLLCQTGIDRDNYCCQPLPQLAFTLDL